MANFTKLTSPTGFEIKYAIRMKSFLVINTNFNPFNCLSFGEDHLSNIEDVQEMQGVETYEDGTGYYIFKLQPRFDRDTLISDIDNVFQHYFIDK